MKISYLLIGIVIIVLSILFMQDDIISLRIKNKGRIVKMEIIDKPKSCIGTRAKWFMKVRYKNEVFSKQMPSMFCETHIVGDVIDVRYIDGEDKIVLLDENIGWEFIASGVFLLVGLYCIIYGLASFLRRR